MTHNYTQTTELHMTAKWLTYVPKLNLYIYKKKDYQITD